MSIWVQKFIDNNNYNQYVIKPESIWNSSYKNIFIGDNLLRVSNYSRKGDFIGNSFLIQTSKQTYVYIGHCIFSFQIEKDDTITKFLSPVGKQWNTLSICNWTKKHVFYKKYIPTSLINKSKDGYEQYYELDKKQSLNLSKM
jgi:hypothetical protein